MEEKISETDKKGCAFCTVWWVLGTGWDHLGIGVLDGQQQALQKARIAGSTRKWTLQSGVEQRRGGRCLRCLRAAFLLLAAVQASGTGSRKTNRVPG